MRICSYCPERATVRALYPFGADRGRLIYACPAHQPALPPDPAKVTQLDQAKVKA